MPTIALYVPAHLWRLHDEDAARIRLICRDALTPEVVEDSWPGEGTPLIDNPDVVGPVEDPSAWVEPEPLFAPVAREITPDWKGK